MTKYMLLLTNSFKIQLEAAFSGFVEINISFIPRILLFFRIIFIEFIECALLHNLYR